ncbi:hypothetical protein PF005_g29476 [Phytophthora fragariae]|uniref:Secreted protein n=2 Tax=Phytophthora TaxID=4783 RepID=A0A6A3DFS1_9STRA|nr:hypothetical protein PF003_g35606 [Phytophthora fragariae]KAE8964596.1 hypothetical protein PR002_g28930 [Phytophthora rubi]KAE8919815.1 hypothetical protein PF009_g29884 [Phytophthora fragariae]KAE8965348.1 hypothetical protein PR001_g28761 [Phytophthora rubi]KAE8987013.1 hypothetical protein PF011_g19747 [Phytophthora fragariae]
MSVLAFDVLYNILYGCASASWAGTCTTRSNKASDSKTVWFQRSIIQSVWFRGCVTSYIYRLESVKP